MNSKTHITDFVEINGQKVPDKLGLVTKTRTLTWAELSEQMLAGADYIGNCLGIQTEQKVIGILLSNSWEFVVAYLAIIRAGHIAMPLDPSYKQLEVDVIIKQIPPEFIISNKAYSHLIGETKIPIVDFSELLTPQTKEFKHLRLKADKQIATLVFTSGTTGKPKASTYSHANHLWNIKVCSEVWKWNRDDSLLISLPLSHWYGIVMGLSGIIYHGNTLYLQEWFDEEDTLRQLSSGKVTMYTAISVAYFKLLEQKGSYDLSKVRLCISGGAALPPTIWQDFKNRFGPEILECYGSSETGRIASNLLDERIPGSPGRPLPEVRIKFGEDNEVMIKSPGVFPGYCKNPGLTQKSLTKDGWWKTGDLGELQNGRVVLKGRLQERIRKAGYSISPRDIEWAMHQNLKIKEIYVMGVQEPASPSDRLVYFINTELSEDEINLYCKQNLIYAWRPDKIIFLNSLPRTKNGKPHIPKLREMLLE